MDDDSPLLPKMFEELCVMLLMAFADSGILSKDQKIMISGPHDFYGSQV